MSRDAENLLRAGLWLGEQRCTSEMVSFSFPSDANKQEDANKHDYNKNLTALWLALNTSRCAKKSFHATGDIRSNRFVVQG